jgi:hypothetical protein
VVVDAWLRADANPERVYLSGYSGRGHALTLLMTTVVVRPASPSGFPSTSNYAERASVCGVYQHYSDSETPAPRGELSRAVVVRFLGAS